MKKTLCSAETAARVCKYLVTRAGSEGRAFFMPAQKKLAQELQLSEIHFGRVLKQLKSDGRLVMNDDRSYCVYLTADVSRVRAAAKKLRQRGSVFDLQQTVNTLLKTVDALLTEIAALRNELKPPAPSALSAAPAVSAPSAQAAEIQIQALRKRWLNAHEAAERAKNSKASSEVIKQAEATESRLFNDYLQAKDKAKLS